MTDRTAKLRESLGRMESLERIEDEGLDYDSPGGAQATWPDILSQWRDAIDELWDIASLHADVMSIGPRGELARTMVPYSGNIMTVCSPFPDMAFVKDHGTQTGFAIDERLLLMRTVLTSMKVMTALAAAWTSPVIAIASARNAWKLVQEVKALAIEYRAHSAAKA